MNEPLVKIKNLSFSYDKQEVLKDINLTINKNEFLAIIGPNGGGKSTLLKLILGMLKPKKGSLKTDNSSIGYVPQNTDINREFPIKVIDVVMMGHIKHPNQKSCALDSLQQVGMEKFADTKIGELSGGQRQRVMIARALSSHPRLLLLDEPTASIDPDGQKSIYELLKSLNKDMTIVVVSHDISVILSLATKVAHINKSLTYHDITKENKITRDGHFCEVEMLQELGKCRC